MAVSLNSSHSYSCWNTLGNRYNSQTAECWCVGKMFTIWKITLAGWGQSHKIVTCFSAFFSLTSTSEFHFGVFLSIKGERLKCIICQLPPNPERLIFLILSLNLSIEIKTDELFLDLELGMFHFFVILSLTHFAVVSRYVLLKEIWIAIWLLFRRADKMPCHSVFPTWNVSFVKVKLFSLVHNSNIILTLPLQTQWGEWYDRASFGMYLGKRWKMTSAMMTSGFLVWPGIVPFVLSIPDLLP